MVSEANDLRRNYRKNGPDLGFGADGAARRVRTV